MKQGTKMESKQTVNPDLANERNNATFDSEQLTYILYDGPKKTARKRYLQNLALKELQGHGMQQYATLSRVEQYEQVLKKHAYMAELEKRLGITESTDKNYILEAVFPCESNPFILHSVFINTFIMLANQEQKAKWLHLMQSYRLVGTYVQTELGHGSFLRGLETTATYDPSTQQFILHCPTASSIKYWPGGLGKTANVCIVMAQLISKGVNYGMHSFLVQIRDLDTHEPLLGITVGDIGNKFGFECNDNGFLRLDHVRIPREQMLMRHSQVLPDGTYIQPKNDRLMYGGMTSLRAGIVTLSSRRLCIAVTIAVRYSAVRRQSLIDAGKGEVQVLDFQSQQYRLLPQLATAYGTTLAGHSISDIYRRISADIDKGNMKQLPLLHALSSGLKAYCAWVCSEGVEVCRLACGGHGYSEASGLPKVYKDCIPSCTYEGENFVLILQTARFVLKSWQMLTTGEPVPEVMNYLKSDANKTSSLDTSLNLADVVEAFSHRAARLAREAAESLQAAISKGDNAGQAWNNNHVCLIAAAKAFTQLYVVRVFAEAVQNVTVPDIRKVMMTLFQLFAVNSILASLGDFLMDGFISRNQTAMLQSRLLDLLRELRPNAVALVDAFDFPDGVLDSVLGRWDGNVYEALYEFSLRSKLNDKQVLDAYHKYQRPFMVSHWQDLTHGVLVKSGL